MGGNKNGRVTIFNDDVRVNFTGRATYHLISPADSLPFLQVKVEGYGGRIFIHDQRLVQQFAEAKKRGGLEFPWCAKETLESQLISVGARVTISVDQDELEAYLENEDTFFDVRINLKAAIGQPRGALHFLKEDLKLLGGQPFCYSSTADGSYVAVDKQHPAVIGKSGLRFERQAFGMEEVVSTLAISILGDSSVSVTVDADSPEQAEVVSQWENRLLAPAMPHTLAVD